jgi:hypothetical protein
VRFVHDWYQPVERTIVIAVGNADAATRLTVDFERDGKLLAGKQIPQGPMP